MMARNTHVFVKMVIQFTIHLACQLLKIWVVSFLRHSSSHLHTLVLVVEEGTTAQEDVLRSAQLVGNEKLIGTVLNKSAAAVSASGSRPGLLRRLLTGSQ